MLAMTMDQWVAWLGRNWIMAGLATVAAVVAVVVLLRNRAGIALFCRGVQVELSKCSWPWDPLETGLRRYKELIDSTVVVVVSMLLLGAYTSTFDFVLMKVTGLVIRMHF
jgi:preprotein translocase subunit SecE